MTVTTTQISWAQTRALNPSSPNCLCCGGPIEDVLARLASNRCQDCRDEERPLDPELHIAFLHTLSPAQLYDLDYPSLGHDDYANDLDTEAVEYRQRLERRAA